MAFNAVQVAVLLAMAAPAACAPAGKENKDFLQLKADAPQCPAPIFVLDGTGKFCVCKDEETCPKTGATLSAEDAATYALAAHAAFKEGGHDAILKMGDPLGAPLSLRQK